MAKNKALTLSPSHQSTLRLLVINRATAIASCQAAVTAGNQIVKAHHEAITEYVLQLLTEAGLDPKVWGISRDFTKFVVIEQPKPAEAPAPTPEAQQAGPQVFSESTPAPAPEAPQA
jgi:hypothetical protein